MNWISQKISFVFKPTEFQ